MGHFYETATGEGRNRAEALHAATASCLEENGTRCTIYGIESERLLETVPPLGVTRIEVYRDGRGRRIVEQTVHDSTARNTAAPRAEWLEKWEFVFHLHA